MRVRSLGFATDLAVLRAGGSIIVEADDHLVVSTCNPGYWWGNFVLVTTPELVARGVEVFHHAFPDAAHLAIGVDGTTAPSHQRPPGRVSTPMSASC